LLAAEAIRSSCAPVARIEGRDPTASLQMQAFAEFYAAARDDCPRIVLISMGDWQLAEDLAADVFTKA
jgi:DNA-directed RNA polymerase specialized sigma24 family protein